MKIINISTFESFQQLYNQYKQQQATLQQSAQQNQASGGGAEVVGKDLAAPTANTTTSTTTNDMRNLILYFIAENDPATKQSWCSDCRECVPVLEKTIEKFQFNDQLTLAIVTVGPRDEWKKSDNFYRTHELAVSAVPTLLSLKNGLRLVEGECKDASKVSHLFSNSM